MIGIDEINLLKSQIYGLKSQNRTLEECFLKILKICNEPADNMAVLELQNRIKEVLNG